jgi:hypothetical protein
MAAWFQHPFRFLILAALLFACGSLVISTKMFHDVSFSDDLTPSAQCRRR